MVAGMLQLFQRWRSGGTHQNHLDMAAASRFWCQYWASARSPFQPLVQHQGQAGQWRWEGAEVGWRRGGTAEQVRRAVA